MITTYQQNLPAPVPHELREQMILEHLPQVHIIASRIHERLPKHVLLEDLISAGVLGLISAVDNFDPSRNVKLRTYAEHKIRGYILNSISKLSGNSRQLTKLRRDVQAAISVVEERTGETPAAEDICAELGMTLDEYHAALNDLQAMSLGSLDSMDPGDDDHSALKYIADPTAMTPERIVEHAELQTLIQRSLTAMPDQERVVLSFYYVEGLNLREIAEIMQLHVTRISQIKTQAILRLRSHLEKLWPGRVDI
jgi:RNA polymerase sigma factor FliA